MLKIITPQQKNQSLQTMRVPLNYLTLTLQTIRRSQSQDSLMIIFWKGIYNETDNSIIVNAQKPT